MQPLVLGFDVFACCVGLDDLLCCGLFGDCFAVCFLFAFSLLAVVISLFVLYLDCVALFVDCGLFNGVASVLFVVYLLWWRIV